MVGGLGEREQVLVSAWLTGLRSARTRRAYAGDVAAWLDRLGGRAPVVLSNRPSVLPHFVCHNAYPSSTEKPSGSPNLG